MSSFRSQNHHAPVAESAAIALDAALDNLIPNPGLKTPLTPSPELVFAPFSRLQTASVTQPGVSTPGDPDILSRMAHPSQIPDLLHTATYLQSLAGSPEPDTSFAAALRRSLFSSKSSRQPSSPPTVLAASPPSRLPATPAAGRFWPAIQVSAMLLLIALLLGTLTGGDTFIPRLVDLAGLRQDPEPTRDVPTFRNSPAGNAAQPGPGPSGPASIHWTFRAGAKLTGNPVIADGIVYTGAFNQRLYAIDAATGTELWSLDTGGTVRGPTVANNVVYVVTGANDLIAVEASTGVERWRVSFDTGMLRSPTVVDGVVYLSTGIMASNYPAVADGTVYTSGGPLNSDMSPDDSILYAFDAESGQERWRVQTGDHLAFYAIDTATGQVRWRQPVDWSTGGAPAVANGVVVVDTGYSGHLIAMDASIGDEIWRYEVGAGPGPAIVDGLLYGASVGHGPVIVDGLLYGANFALDLKFGRERWRNDAVTPVQAAPAIVDDTAYLMTEQGVLHAVETATGAERWRTVVGFQIQYALSPIVSGGFIYVAASDGALYALGDPLPATTTSSARDVPDPADCQGERVAPEDVAAIVGTPDPPSNPEPFVWPIGTPASAEDQAAVTATYRELIACTNAGDPLRTLPLFTDAFHARSSQTSFPPDNWGNAATPQPVPDEERTAILAIEEIQLLPDGRIGALVTTETHDPNDLPWGPVKSFIFFAKVDGRWLIDDIVTIDNAPQAQGLPATASVATPRATPTDAFTIQLPVSLRDDATFAVRVSDHAAPGTTLRLVDSGEIIDGIHWVPVNGLVGGLGPDHTYYLPAAYLIAGGARVPGILVPSTERTNIPHPGECMIEPIPLADVATYMGPTGTVGERSAMTYLATGVDLREAEPVRGMSTLDAEREVMITLREAIACQNAGSFTQSVALYSQGYFQRAGAAAYRPNGSESELATPHPLPTENRTEILAIGDLALLDDGRVGIIVITAAHAQPIGFTAAYVIFAPAGDRWLIDDAITIDSSGDPSGYVIPTTPLELAPSATPATVSAEAAAIVEAYFAEPTSTLTVATPTEPSRTAIAQPMFPVGTTVAVRGDTITLRAIPRTNGEIIARLGPCACAMEVTGPMADSGDALWLPVTDLDTGVSGYVSLDVVLPERSGDLGSFQIGETVTTTSPVRLRDAPDPSASAGPPIPAGTTLEIAATKISAGHSWIMVPNPDGGGVKWIAHDILVAAITSDAPPSTPASSSRAQPPKFSIGQRVTVTSDGVMLREAPFTDSNVVDILQEGTRLEITGAPEEVDDATWYPARNTTSGDGGYVSGDFLEIGSPPDATPAPTQGATSSPLADGSDLEAGQIVTTTTVNVNAQFLNTELKTTRCTTLSA